MHTAFPQSPSKPPPPLQLHLPAVHNTRATALLRNGASSATLPARSAQHRAQLGPAARGRLVCAGPHAAGRAAGAGGAAIKSGAAGGPCHYWLETLACAWRPIVFKGAGRHRFIIELDLASRCLPLATDQPPAATAPASLSPAGQHGWWRAAHRGAAHHWRRNPVC